MSAGGRAGHDLHLDLAEPGGDALALEHRHLVVADLAQQPAAAVAELDEVALGHEPGDGLERSARRSTPRSTRQDGVGHGPRAAPRT